MGGRFSVTGTFFENRSLRDLLPKVFDLVSFGLSTAMLSRPGAGRAIPSNFVGLEDEIELAVVELTSSLLLLSSLLLGEGDLDMAGEFHSKLVRESDIGWDLASTGASLVSELEPSNLPC